MRRSLPLLLLLAAACAGPRGPKTAVAPPAEPAPGSVSPSVANFQLLVDEVVLDPAQEGVSHTTAHVDGAEAGRTATGPRGTQKRLLLELKPGNRLLHLEHLIAPPGGELAPVFPDRQRRERFVRIEDGYVTRVFLRYAPSGPAEMIVQREPKGSFELKP